MVRMLGRALDPPGGRGRTAPEERGCGVLSEPAGDVSNVRPSIPALPGLRHLWTRRANAGRTECHVPAQLSGLRDRAAVDLPSPFAEPQALLPGWILKALAVL